jgi:hypothetical protein
VRKGAVRTLPLALSLASLLAGVASDSASARWERISQTPTNSAPYFACPSRARVARCQLIEDPTRGVHARGPLPAGAITKGPVQEISPATTGSGVEGGYAPADLQSAYRLPSSSAGTGQTVAVVDAFDDPKAEADLNVYRAEYGLGACTHESGCFRKVDQRGDNALPRSDRTWAREISLDLDMVSAICPSCHILLVEADNEDGANLAAGQQAAVALGASEISDSYEEPQTSEHAAAYDHPGVPIVVAAGDQSYGVVSPAASPHVIAVGGTSLVPAAGRRGWEETVWHSEGGAGTGSGCSIEPKPAWQTDVGCTHRTVNDIAAVADPNTPVSAYDSFETAHAWQLLGGTSVSAPIVAAAIALTTPYSRTFDGAQALYLDLANGGGFNDVVSGVNGKCAPYAYLCEAGPGYDGPSGLGTLNGAPEVPPPAPATGGSSSVSQREATLLGAVNPHGVPLSGCGFRYGTTAAYGSVAPCTPLPSGGTNPVGVSAVVAGLSPGTLYHFRLQVSFAGGAAEGADRTFSTAGIAPTFSAGEASNLIPSAPSVATLAATAVGQTSATLNATVNANGAALAKCEFEFNSAETLVPCSSTPAALAGAVAVSASVKGLAAGSVYRYRIIAANTVGTTYGSLIQFASLRSPSQLAARYAARLASTRMLAGADGIARVKLRCPAAHHTRCRGTIILASEQAGARHGIARGTTLTLASGAFAVPAGRVLTLRLHLLASARESLERVRVLRVRVTVRTAGRRGTSAWHGAGTLSLSR